MNLTTTTMLAILDGHGNPQERQEMRRLMQAAGVDAPLQRWRTVGVRLELTLLNGKIIYLPEGEEHPAAPAQPEQAADEPEAAAAPSAPGARAASPSNSRNKSGSKRRQGGEHGLRA